MALKNPRFIVDFPIQTQIAMFDSQRAGGYFILGPTVPSRLRMINPTFAGLAAPSLASSSFSDTEIMRSSIHHSAKDGRTDKKNHEIWKDLSNFQDLSRVFEDLPPDFAVKNHGARRREISDGWPETFPILSFGHPWGELYELI